MAVRGGKWRSMDRASVWVQVVLVLALLSASLVGVGIQDEQEAAASQVVTLDLMGRLPSGDLDLIPGDGAGGWGSSVQVGTGWGMFDLVFSPGDFDGDGLSDVMGRTPSGDLLLYPGNGAGSWGATSQVGSGWGMFDLVFSPGDFDGDGLSDVMGRTPNGDLFLYPGNGAGSWGTTSQVGSGWNMFDTLVGPGDVDNDGTADVLGRDSNGDLHLYRGDGSGGWGASSNLGSAWSAYDLIFAAGDFNGGGAPLPSEWSTYVESFAAGDFDGDGNPDVVGRTAGGDLFLHPSDGAGDFAPRVQIGHGWQIFDRVFGPGDFDGDGLTDVMARKPNGDLWLYPGNGIGGWGTAHLVGTGWNMFDRVFGPGDFDGDGHADVMAREPNGNLWLYPGNGGGSWLAQRIVDSGWNTYADVFDVQDWNADGAVDVATRTPDGEVRVHYGTGSGGLSSSSAVDGTYDTSVLGVGDLLDDGYPDLLTIGVDGEPVIHQGLSAADFIVPVPAPTELTATTNGVDEVTLSWTDWSLADIDHFLVHRDRALIATVVGGTSYLDSSVMAGSIYRYEVTAVEVGGDGSQPSAPLYVDVSAGATGVLDPAPTEFLASAGAIGESIQLSWDAPAPDSAISSVRVLADGIEVASVDADTRVFDAPASLEGTETWAISSRADDGTSSALQALDVVDTAQLLAATDVPTCRAVALADGQTLVRVDAAPAGWSKLLYEDESGEFVPFQWLKQHGDLADVSYGLDAVTPHAGSDTGRYRVVTHRSDESVVTYPCEALPFSQSVYDEFHADGFPVLPEGLLGVDVALLASGGGSPIPVATAGPAMGPQEIGSISDICSTGGLHTPIPMDVAGTEIFTRVTIPSGASFVVDWVTGKHANGNWSGRASLYEVGADDSIGNAVESRTAPGPGYWVWGEERTDDWVVYTNYGPTRDFFFSYRTLVVVSIYEGDGGFQEAVNPRFTNGAGEQIGDPCAPAEYLDCLSAGGNLYLETQQTIDGTTLGRGCYFQESCAASSKSGILEWAAKWSCKNQDMLQLLELYGTIIVVGGGLVVLGGAVGIGAAAGLAISVWSCNQNPHSLVAQSFDDLNLACAATETALGGVFGAATGAGLSSGITTFGRTVAIACGWGAAEGSTGSAAHAYVQPDQVIEATDVLLGAAVGCTTAGVIGGGGQQVATRVGGSAPGSLLADASQAAFDAADNIGSFTVKPKHLPGAGGKWNKFDYGVDPNSTIQEALRSEGALFLPNPNLENTFRVVADLERPIGTRGETAIRVIVGFDGNVINAFPVKTQ